MKTPREDDNDLSMDMNQQKKCRLIGLDWGTTSLRSYLLGDGGAILQQRSFPLGVMHLQERIGYVQGKVPVFESALEESCGDWMSLLPSLPMLASGMVGSDRGWKEVPYLSVPCDLSVLHEHLVTLENRWMRKIYCVPGLFESGSPPEVMRGEETQVFGAMSINEGPILFGLPGTHSKWVQVSKTCIRHFKTFMTGEIFKVLCRHTVLGAMMADGAEDIHSFHRGVSVSMKDEERHNSVLSSIFSVRTLGITRKLPPESQADYLSGLLIGHEVSSLRSWFHLNQPSTTPIILAGDENLCARYAYALKQYGYEAVQISAHATPHGLWKIAVQALL